MMMEMERNEEEFSEMMIQDSKMMSSSKEEVK